jgi:hypothetical protein
MTNPASGDADAPIDGPITVMYSANIQEGDTWSAITLKDAGETTVTIAAAISQKTLTITPAASLAYASTYTITIPNGVIKNAVNTSTISLYSFSFTTADTPTGGGGGGGGGSSSPTPLQDKELTQTPEATESASLFTDIAPDAWYEGFVAELISRSIINGYPDGTFKPVKPVTRAEFAKMVCIAMGWDIVAQSAGPFTDIKEGNWAARYIETIKKHGAIGGYTDNTFRPNKTATRAEMAKMIAGVLKE